ncbi:MAG TPA: hypothetical protein VGN34_32560 [Ktedonobacteraceae bacterium]|jgi:hypothetical protein|nr:hypothetical protein [Ktedonobacteraceae bacterium]
MNKTKRVAWHKHLAKAKKFNEKQRQAQKASGPVTSSTARR